MSVLDQLEEPTEAVIISGPRKGEFITVAKNAPRNEEEFIVTPQMEALLDEAIQSANDIAQTLRTMRQESAAFREEMKGRRDQIDELLGTIRRIG